MPIIKECDYNPIKNELNVLDNFYTQSDNYIDFLSKYLHYSQINGISNVTCFDSGSDLKNVNNVVLDFSVGGLSLPSREYYKSSDIEDKLLLFRNHLENVKNILQEWITLDKDFVNNVLDFENKIADYTLTPDQSREYDKSYTNSD